MTEPILNYATVREADDTKNGFRELHIECRMSDGQKGAFATVDYEFPKMARLFAAAPGLLEALKEADADICLCCKRLNPQHENCTTCPGREVRLAAIAKAEGKEDENE